MHFAGDHTLGFNLNSALGKNNAVKTARDDHAVAFDLALNFGSLAENDGLLRDNVALYVPVNTKRAFELERTFQCHALVDEACLLFTVTPVL